MSERVEGPKVVEVGQRWGKNPGKRIGYEYVVTAVIGGEAEVMFSDGAVTRYPFVGITCDDYLGPSPAPATPGRPRPEKGQRWKDTGDAGTIVIDAIDPDSQVYPVKFHWEDDGTSGAWELDMHSFDFISPASPPPPGMPGPVMGADAKGNPVSCLFCGVAAPVVYSGYACEPCIVAKSIGQLSDAKLAWDAGARDFPRLPPGTSTAAAKQCPGVTGGECDCVPAKPAYGRMVGEIRAADGTPLTALQAIQSCKPPEPWRPSVDEYDLLPDAGTSWSDPGSKRETSR